MATVRFTDDDRDSRGFIRLSPPMEDAAPAEAPAAPPRIRRPAPAPGKRVPMPRALIVLAYGGLIGLLLIAVTIRFGAVPGRIAPRPPVATATAQSSTSMPATVVTAAPHVAMIDAYAAPNGATLGEIEATRAITPTAHYGQDWIQAEVAGSGLIWLRAADWPRLAITGPDLAPRPTATARPYVPPTAEPQPPCAEVGVSGKMVRVCDWLEPDQLRAAAAAKWIATYGGNVGIVTTLTPYGGTP